ncbi:MAG: mechanosensitive ion channel family protein [Chitinispirillaceae bacterium]|nr:mechanosensitive ion channel family protein [Chitinispirillaceae bacterium]
MNSWLTPEFWQEMLQKSVQWMIETVPSLVFILILALVLLKGIKILVSRLKPVMLERMKSGGTIEAMELEKRVETMTHILTSAIRLAIWIITCMLLLRKVGIDIAPLIAGAGIVGLAIGFGAQEMVRDMISGFFMLLENQVRTGDVAIVNGTGGLVEKVGLRTIVLRDLSGVVHVFQNGKINSLSNMTKEWSAIVFDIGVAYKEDTDRVVEIMKRVAEEMRADEEYAQKILEPMEVFGVDQFGDSAVVVKARLKTPPIMQWVVGREYRRRLKKAFDAEKIEIPFPHQTIYWGAEIAPLRVLSGEAK